MPETEVILYAEDDGSCPALDWLDDQPPKVQDKFIVRIERLKELGHELRRPEADTLRDGIHELRLGHQRVNYRLLYFFSGRRAVVSHGLTKEDKVLDKDIELALRRKQRFERDPERHTHNA
jgi:phage-related protein